MYYLYFVSYFDNDLNKRVKFNLNLYDYTSKESALKFAKVCSDFLFSSVRVTIVKCEVIEVVNL